MSYAVGFAGAMAIDSSLAWYVVVVNRPLWTPPGWILVPVWTVLHGLIGGAGWAVWSSPPKTGGRSAALVELSLFAVANAAWAGLLFYGHRALPAFAIALAACGLALMAAVAGGRATPIAGRLLVPVVLWTAYAAGFTGFMWRLNR